MKRARAWFDRFFAFAAAVTPPAWRFSLAMQIAAACGRLSALTSVLFRLDAPRLGSTEEYYLAHLMEVLDTRGLEFAPAFAVSGIDAITDRDSEGAGILLATTHANAGLARSVLRAFHERNISSVVISSAAAFPVCGTKLAARCIDPGAASLLSVRNYLRAGEVVCAMVDSSEPLTRRSVAVDAPDGSHWIAEPLFHIAEACGAGIVLLRATLHPGRIALEFTPGCSLCGASQIARHLGASALTASAPCPHSATDPACEMRPRRFAAR